LSNGNFLGFIAYQVWFRILFSVYFKFHLKNQVFAEMFLPTTPQEIKKLGWDKLDVILVTGDSYIDSPYIGIAVIGKILLRAGYRVGVIAQPAVDSAQDIMRLGEPALFWGVSGGSIDSMVANFTATLKRRHHDDYTPGGENTRRPDRAVIAYANLIRRYFKHTRPIVLGGIESSLRRVAHYDYWSNRLRGSILLDAKADFLIYGMAERSVIELANALKNGTDPTNIRGLCYPVHDPKPDYLILPSYEEVCADKDAFIRMFHLFYQNNDPLNAKGLCQSQGTRFLIQNPPAYSLTQAELDDVYTLDFERSQHPFYEQMGKVKALETIKFAIPTHRGCYGECNFCAIAVHEGRTVQWRSVDSILSEARTLVGLSDFKGYIQDVGGPTANMYGFECVKKNTIGSCPERRCLFPNICPALKINHRVQLDLLKKIRSIPGVKKAFVASGIRYDLLSADRDCGMEYLREVVEHHTSGQMKIAPEHSEESVLRLMGKPSTRTLNEFKTNFDQLSRQAGKPQFLTYYFIAAYPGCTEQEMQKLKTYINRELRITPEQVQVFTPTPSTYASLMYYTEKDPFTSQPLFVEKGLRGKERQKEIITTSTEQRPGHPASTHRREKER
jgi:uncharacterized radical SAM protein YgiQ